MYGTIYRKMLFLGLAVCWSFLCLGALGFAQQAARPQAQDHRLDIDDEELGAFVKAYVENQKIRREFEPRLNRSKDAEEMRRIQDEANAGLKQSLAKHDLTIDQYNKIYLAVNNNEQLRAKTLKLIEDERKRTGA
jgi:hypothetical protein